jgi:hypothetical protein
VIENIDSVVHSPDLHVECVLRGDNLGSFSMQSELSQLLLDRAKNEFPLVGLDIKG